MPTNTPILPQSNLATSEEMLLWHDAEGLLPWENAWKPLNEMAETPWSTWPAINAMLLSSVPPQQPCIHAQAMSGALQAMAPVTAVPLGKAYRLMPLASELHPFPFEIVAKSSESLDELVRELLSSDLPIDIPRMWANSDLYESLARQCRRNRRLCSMPTSAGRYLDLDASWAEPIKNLAAERRAEFRMAQRKAEPYGPCEFISLQPSLADLANHLAECRSIEQVTWKLEKGATSTDGKLATNLEQALIRKFAQRQQFVLHQLRFQGKLAAFAFSILHRHRLWMMKCACSPQYSKCHPGILILDRILADCVARELSGIEFPARQDESILFWNPSVREQLGVRIIPYNRAGFDAWIGKKRRDLAGRISTRLRTPGQYAASALAWPTMQIADFAARAYSAGPEISDAVERQKLFHAKGMSTMVAFRADDKLSAETVAREYQLALKSLDRGRPPLAVPSFLIQPTTCDINMSVLGELADYCQANGIRLCCDASCHAATDATFSAADALCRRGIDRLTVTLPARWQRSMADANWAIDRGISVRLVLGDEKDPGGDVRAARESFVELALLLAGNVDHLGIATGDLRLAEETLSHVGKRHGKSTLRNQQRAAASPVEWEIPLGFQIARGARLAQDWRVGYRVLVPYGNRALPYRLADIYRQPQILGWLFRDLLRFGKL